MNNSKQDHKQHKTAIGVVLAVTLLASLYLANKPDSRDALMNQPALGQAMSQSADHESNHRVVKDIVEVPNQNDSFSIHVFSRSESQ